jgi:hypothetical protein
MDRLLYVPNIRLLQLHEPSNAADQQHWSQVIDDASSGKRRHSWMWYVDKLLAAFELLRREKNAGRQNRINDVCVDLFSDLKM